MAFVDPTQPGEEENNQNPSQVDQVLNPSSSQQTQQQSQSQQAPPSTSAGGAGVASTGSSASGSPGGANPAPASTPKPSSSGSWTNLDSYLGANADQATSMGQQIAQSVNNAGNQAQTDVNNLSSNFTADVNKNVVNQNPDAVNTAISDASALTAGQTLSAEDQQAFNQQANASYSGPTDVTSYNGYNQAQQDVNAATQKAAATKTEAGRATLLNDQYGNTSQYGYTLGENNLDQLLLQNSGGAQAALEPLADQWSSLNGAINNSVQNGAQEVQTAQNTNQATAAAATNALDTTTQNFQDQINTGLANLQQTDSASYQQILNDIQNGGLTASDQEVLGIDPTQHNYLQNSSFNTYFTPGAAPTLATYATGDQYAEAEALAQLAGQQTSPYLSPATIAQAGTAETTPAYTFNNKQYNSDQTAAQSEYNSAQSFLLNEMNQGFTTAQGTPQTNWGFSSIPDAVNKLNQVIASWGGSDPGSGQGQTVAWAQQQLNKLNQLNSTYNFPQVNVTGGANNTVRT